MTFSFKQLQEEMKPWVEHNFHPTMPHRPLLGMIEEFSEFIEAETEEAENDAAGDMLIFLADYCTQTGLDLQGLWEQRIWTSALRAIDTPSVLLGHIAHAQLKIEQGIRGDSTAHKDDIEFAIQKLLGWVNASFDNVLEIVERIWAEVRQRDFKKFPKNGKTE